VHIYTDQEIQSFGKTAFAFINKNDDVGLAALSPVDLLDICVNDHNTLLSHAASRGSLACVGILIKRGVNIESQEPQYSPLNRANYYDHPSCVALLIRAEAKYDHVFLPANNTILDLCVFNKKVFPAVRETIMDRVRKVGYEPALECTLKSHEQYRGLFDEAAQAIIVRAKTVGCDETFQRFISKHPE
jgi:hypothetical protein